MTIRRWRRSSWSSGTAFASSRFPWRCASAPPGARRSPALARSCTRARCCSRCSSACSAATSRHARRTRDSAARVDRRHRRLADPARRRLRAHPQPQAARALRAAVAGDRRRPAGALRLAGRAQHARGLGGRRQLPARRPLRHRAAVHHRRAAALLDGDLEAGGSERDPRAAARAARGGRRGADAEAVKVRAAVLATAALVAAATAPAALAAYRPVLAVSGSQLTFTQPAGDEATARIAVAMPPASRLTTGQAPGTVLGTARAQVTISGFDVGAFAVDGRVVTGDASRYAAAAAACGVTALDAVWVVELAAQGRSFSFPAFVERAGGAPRLLVCFPSPYIPEAQGGAPFGVKLVEAVLTLPGVLGAPTTSGRHVWSGMFTPYVAGSATPGPTVEARAIVPVPNRLTLRARGGRRALLSGRLTEAGAHPAGVRVELYAVTPSRPRVKLTRLARARTGRGGRFVFRRPAARALRYTVLTEPRRVACPGSTAPGGCVGALVAPAGSRVVRVRAARPR